MKDSTLLKIYLFIAIFSLGISAKGQDSCINLLKEGQKYVSISNPKNILRLGTEWEQVAFYDNLKDSMTIYLEPQSIKILSKNRIKYITAEDKLTFKGKKAFKIVFGGRGPEKQKYEIKYYDENCLILESTFTNKGFYNRKLVYYEQKTIRYLWKKK